MTLNAAPPGRTPDTKPAAATDGTCPICPEVLTLIAAERGRQREIWNRPHEWGHGDCSSPLVDPMVKLAVLLEEVGEVARALLERESVRDELSQVAAVAVAWLETA